MNYFQKIEDKKKWQELLNKTLFKTFFHNLEWEGFLEKNFQWLKFERFLYKNEALLSLAKYKILGEERLISHPFCEYGGPLPLKEGIDGRKFRNDVFSDFKLSLKIRFHPQIPKYFKNFGLKEPDSSIDTYLIEDFDKKSEEKIYSSFRKTLRHSIRKAQDRGLEIKRCESENELKVFYNLYLRTAKRHKTIPSPLSFFKYFLEHSVSDANNRAEIVLAEYKNKIVAGSIFLFYEKLIHYCANASDERYKKFFPNHLILWKQIKKYARKNYLIFDFGGTGRGSTLEVFKRGWGVKRYPIFEIKNFPESKLKESKLRNVFSVLPPFLIEKISPFLLKYRL